MSKPLIRLAAVLAALVLSASGQLYLLTGSPTPKSNETFGSALLEVTESGTVLMVADLVPKDVGIKWIAMSQEHRKAVILPGYKDKNVLVFDLDKVAVTKRCERPQIANTSLINQWLADLPSWGPSFVWYVTGDDPRKGTIQAMTLDASTSCADTFPSVDANIARYLISSGVSGVADLGSAEGMHVAVNDNGRMLTVIAGVIVDTGSPVPLQFLPIDFARITANNDHELVLSTYNETSGSRTLVYRKGDKTWHVVPIRTDEYHGIRIFGGLMAIAESIEKRFTPEKSPGGAEWRELPSNWGPNLADRLGHARAVFPGRLHIYDVDTEKMNTIATNQADSEILLIENHTVYYRVNDGLFTAELTNAGIGKSRLLAKDEAIRDAHWAFLKH